MNQAEQFDLLKVDECPSPRLLRIAELDRALERAKSKFNIMTHYTPHIEEAPWLAYVAHSGERRNIGQIAAEECNTPDYDMRSFYDLTERDAVIQAAEEFHPNTPELRDLVELRELEEKR